MSYAFAYVFAASATSAAATASPHPSTEEAALRAEGGRSSSVDGCGEAVEAAEVAEAAKTCTNAYEISESLGPELYI